MVGDAHVGDRALFDQFLEPGAIGKAGQAVGDELAAQVALGHHFLRPVDQRQQEQSVIARFGGQRADRAAQVARRGSFAELAGKFLRFVRILRCALDRAQHFDRRLDTRGGQAQPVERGVACMEPEIAARHRSDQRGRNGQRVDPADEQ